jgi:Fic family protein
MTIKIPSNYDSIHQFEPLLPRQDLDELHAQTLEIEDKSSRLGNSIHCTTVSSIQELVRSMNSYYSNRIEGQSTHPANIERALAHDFSDRPDIAKLQRVAVAYIDAEKELERIGGRSLDPTLRSTTLIDAHRALYHQLAPEDRTTPEGRVIEPGQIRQEQVTVGNHLPPIWSSIPNFLNRIDQVYAKQAPSSQSLIYIASAHQRAMWVHPFLDGNGRAVRLQTHLALLNVTKGLWSMNRGLARNRDAYYSHLARADEPRHGDLDGRGNLSEKMLHAWCQWFIGIAFDQVSFMEKMLNLSEMRKNIEALISFRASHDKEIRREAIAPLYQLYLAGPTKRGDFLQMTGLGERTARSLLARLLKTRMVTSESHKAPIQFAFPLDSLQFLLPNLYPEASTLDIEK